MKKSMIFVFVLIALLGLMMIYNKSIRVMFFAEKETVGTVTQQDLEIINDTKDSISVQYKKELGKASIVAKPNEVAPGGNGFLSIQTADKKGYYEIRYLFPRPANKLSRIALSQIIEAVKGIALEVEGELRVAKGNIDDIAISYEEIG